MSFDWKIAETACWDLANVLKWAGLFWKLEGIAAKLLIYLQYTVPCYEIVISIILPYCITTFDPPTNGHLEFGTPNTHKRSMILFSFTSSWCKILFSESVQFQERVPNAGSFVVQVLKEILREIDSTLTEDDLENIIEEVDEDGSGTMDFDEFQAMMMG